jgi:lipid II:glycine glycyltransferase (peptidoglycan interpeptide bridge formation enzyme)
MPLPFFENAFKILYPKKMAKLFLASVNDKIIAGSLFLIHRWYMVYFMNASVREFLRFQPNNLIQWKSIIWAKNNGIKLYDLGGAVDPSYGSSFIRGVYQYKKRWGGRKVNHDYFYSGRIYGTASFLFYKNELARRIISLLRSVQVV